MSYLVDTNLIITGLHGRPEALAFLEDHRADGLDVRLITLGEVYEGAYTNPEPDEHIASFQAFLALFTVLPLAVSSCTHSENVS